MKHSERLVLENTEMSPDERAKWRALADKITSLKKGEHRTIDKLIDALQRGFPDAARTLCDNEADKFSEYRETLLPLLVEELYGGTGSPWFSVERKLRERNKA